ncbi:MAG: hypothetical protein AB7N54_04105 [Alphaproteobacteria bacterium]
MSVAASVMIAVEDPGAANMAADLPAALAARGLAASLFAGGAGSAQLDRLGRPHRRIAAGTTAGALLDEDRPRAVVVGTSEDRSALGLALVDAARGRGIATLGLVDGPANAAERFRGTGAAADTHAPDLIAVADIACRDAFLAAGFAATRLVVAGHPAFDRARAERRHLDARGRAAVRAAVFPDAPAGRPVVVFLSELSDGLDAARFALTGDETLRGRPGTAERTRAVTEAFLDATAGLATRPWRVLRLHPKERREDHADLLDEFDAVSAEGPPFEVLYAADLVVGLTTFALVEALLLGRPALSLLPRASDAAWLPAIGLGLVPMVCRNAEIAPAVLRFAGREPDAALLARHMPEGAAAHLAELIAGRVAVAAGAA